MDSISSQLIYNREEVYKLRKSPVEAKEKCHNTLTLSSQGATDVSVHLHAEPIHPQITEE